MLHYRNKKSIILLAFYAVICNQLMKVLLKFMRLLALAVHNVVKMVYRIAEMKHQETITNLKEEN